MMTDSDSPPAYEELGFWLAEALQNKETPIETKLKIEDESKNTEDVIYGAIPGPKQSAVRRCSMTIENQLEQIKQKGPFYYGCPICFYLTIFIAVVSTILILISKFYFLDP